MAGSSIRVTLDNTEKIKRLTRAAVSRAVRKTAFAIQEEAATNIQQHGLIDTGAMRSSVYVETHDQSGHGTAVSGAKALNPEAPIAVKGKVPHDELEARVAVAAEYAIYHEMGAPGAGIPARPFLAPAAEKHQGTLRRLAEEELS